MVKDISVLFLISQLWQHVSSGNSFRGILANGAVANTKSVLKVGAIYDSDIFYNSKISRENIAIYVGRLDPNKNVDVLISLWGKIYEKFGTKLFLIGGTHVPDYFNTIKNQIDGNKIEHIFWLSTSELKNYYDTCCLSIMPSKRESLCWSVVESLACGCTCVVDGEYTGMGHEIKPYIVGESLSWTNSLDKFVYNALEQNIKKDASEYMKGYSIKARKNEVISFIEGRL